MHFGFVEKGYPGSSGGGGAGTFVQVMGRYLVREGHRVTVVARTRDGGVEEESDQGVRVFRVPVSYPRSFALYRLPLIRSHRHAARYRREGRVVAQFLDRLHAEDPFDLVEYSEGGDFWHRRNRSFKVVSHLHGSRYTFMKESGHPVEKADWHQRKLELAFIRQADWVLAPSKALAGIVAREAAAALGNVTIRPYPLDVVSAAGVESTEASHGLMRVVFAARNDPMKGGDVLLDAVREIERCGGGVEFDFYGFLPESGQDVPESVKIHGFIPRETLLVAYGRADVAVVPSFWDNSPNTVYEAMAACLPVIGSAVGGIPELIQHEETGFLVQARDWRSIAQHLLQLRDDPEMRRRMGRAGRKRILTLADPEPNLDARLGVYRAIVSGFPVPSRNETT